MASMEATPCETVSQQTISLSVPDAVAPKNWSTEVLFWHLQDTDTFEKAKHDLEMGLGRLLADVPILLGKLARGPKDHPLDIVIKINEGASVAFPHEDAANVPDIPPMGELLSNGLPLMDALRKAVTPATSLEPVVEGSAVFCTKLTRLKDGAALAVGFSHVLTDGITASMMERIWAMHTLHVSRGLPFRKYKLETPDEEIRARLSTPARCDTEADLDSFLEVVSATEARSHLHKDVASAKEAANRTRAIMMGHLAELGEKPEARGFALWKFTPEKLIALKKAASGHDAEDWISTLDALTALFWSRVACALGENVHNHQKSRCIFMISTRQRLQPSVPNEYIGNVFSPAVAACSISTLITHEVGLKAAAQSMRKASKEWTQSRWEAWLSKIISLPADQALSVDRKTFLQKHDFSFNDYSRFQSNDIDWGTHLGRVARTRYLKRALPAGAFGAHVHPRLPDGSLEVSLVCSDELRRRLQKDPVFMRYAELMCFHT
ncbi:hypothetical protein DOTSEDRAFT_73802 [Dothistroma septosporum NZE10]|uniref:Uncharacterized protein n=1 Tax=Dothistroma septosporum (strain NZE10 / CBS 128990) TaxID=675120 RepID=N1PFV8_DOTSN|nr:hypothetical protein DOTSEDRAFT_73802 [Dothistroma septosporum NZE10]